MKWYKLMFAFAVNVILNLFNDCHQYYLQSDISFAPPMKEDQIQDVE